MSKTSNTLDVTSFCYANFSGIAVVDLSVALFQYYPLILTFIVFGFSLGTKDVLLIYFAYFSKMLWSFNLMLQGIVGESVPRPECQFDLFSMMDVVFAKNESSFAAVTWPIAPYGFPSIEAAQMGCFCGFVTSYYCLWPLRPASEDGDGDGDDDDDDDEEGEKMTISNDGVDWRAVVPGFWAFLFVFSGSLVPGALWLSGLSTSSQVVFGFYEGFLFAIVVCYWFDRYLFPVWISRWLAHLRIKNDYGGLRYKCLRFILGSKDRFDVVKASLLK